MKGFKLKDGDIEIVENKISMVSGNDLLRQTTETVLGTNKGEWVLNPDEGIKFSTILGKKPTLEKDTSNEAMKKYFQNTISDMREDDAELAQKLAERLDGEDE